MTTDPTMGPACGNNPNVRLTDGDRRAVAEFRAYLADRTVLRDRIAEAVQRLHENGGVYALDAGEPERIADAVLAVLPVPPAPTTDQATLSDTERQFLGFALDLAADRMASRSDEFGDEDEAALAVLRRLAAGAQQPECGPECSEQHTYRPGCAQAVGAQQQPTTETLAAALDGIHGLIACSSRDWGEYRVDAWLWAVLCGWDCEQTEHDDTCTHGAMEEMAERHGWDADTVAKARRYRAAVRALTDPIAAPQPTTDVVSAAETADQIATDLRTAGWDQRALGAEDVAAVLHAAERLNRQGGADQ